MRGLKDKVIVVAGSADGGIGAETAARLGEEGAVVVVGDLDGDSAEIVAARIVKSGGRAVAHQFDIGDEKSVDGLIAKAVKQFGGLDGIHCNAAAVPIARREGDLLEVSMADFDETMRINVRGHVLCTRRAIPELLKRGRGTIVYTSSAGAYSGPPTRASYAISKNALHALARSVAGRWGKEGIRANVVALGMILTRGLKAEVSAERQVEFLSRVKSPRLGEPRDAAAMVSMLMSEDAEWVNGQVISVNGGSYMRD